MEYVNYFLQAVAYFLPYVACLGAGAYLDRKFGNKVAAEIAVLKADLAALKAKL